MFKNKRGWNFVYVVIKFWHVVYGLFWGFDRSRSRYIVLLLHFLGNQHLSSTTSLPSKHSLTFHSTLLLLPITIILFSQQPNTTIFIGPSHIFHLINISIHGKEHKTYINRPRLIQCHSTKSHQVPSSSYS